MPLHRHYVRDMCTIVQLGSGESETVNPRDTDDERCYGPARFTVAGHRVCRRHLANSIEFLTELDGETPKPVMVIPDQIIKKGLAFSGESNG